MRKTVFAFCCTESCVAVIDFPFSRNLGDEAVGIVDRSKMLRFLLSLKRTDGSFALHDRGETDTRGSTQSFFNIRDETLI